MSTLTIRKRFSTIALESKILNLLYRLRIPLCILAALIIYLASFPIIYAQYFVHLGKPISSGKMMISESEMYHGVDHFEITTVAGERVYELDGWAFPPNSPLSPESFMKQVVLLDHNSTAYLFRADSMERKDITTYFKDIGRNLDQAGFTSYISEYALSPGIYRIGVLYMNSKAGTFYCLTDRYLERTPNYLRLLDVKTENAATPTVSIGANNPSQ